jgi:hypothetical protein
MTTRLGAIAWVLSWLSGCPMPPPAPAEAPEPAQPAAEPPEPAEPGTTFEPPPPERPATADPALTVCRAEAAVLSCAGGRRATACEGLRIRAEGREPDRAGAEEAALSACRDAVAQQQADPQWRTEVETECAVRMCATAAEVDRCRRLSARACRFCGPSSGPCGRVRDVDRSGDMPSCGRAADAWERVFGAPAAGASDDPPEAADRLCREFEDRWPRSSGL